MALVPSAKVSPMTRLADEAFERIYSNIENGLLKGTSSTNQATVPQGYRLVIEYISGFIYSDPHRRP